MTETELSSPTSTTSSSSSSDSSHKKTDDKASYKKSNKPMMEKKRRARINFCLTQLKSLVLQAMKKDNSQYSKLEKADILELTVRHLKNVQRHQVHSIDQHPDAVNKYRAGFNECANEVVKYLGESQGVNEEARTRIISHLASILSPFNALPLHQTHTPILPAPLQHVHQQQHQSHLQQFPLQHQQQHQSHLQQFPLQHQQQHQSHLQQFPLQHQQNQSVFLASSSQTLSSDVNNTKSIIPYPTFLSSAGGTLDIGQLVSNSPTAFQSPVAAGVAISSGLQLPCIATAAMTTTTQFQLLPTSLSTGHVALVLTPQTIPAMNTYTTHQGIRPQGYLDTEGNKPKIFSQLEDCKPQGIVGGNHTTITKQLRHHRQGNIVSAGLYPRSSTSCQTRPPLDHKPSMFLMAPSPQSSNLNMNQSTIFKSSTVSNNTATSTVATTNTYHNSANNWGMNVVRTTSTWRPW